MPPFIGFGAATGSQVVLLRVGHWKRSVSPGRLRMQFGNDSFLTVFIVAKMDVNDTVRE